MANWENLFRALAFLAFIAISLRVARIANSDGVSSLGYGSDIERETSYATNDVWSALPAYTLLMFVFGMSLFLGAWR